jgi:ADP-ribose pyrophosphatase
MLMSQDLSFSKVYSTPFFDLEKSEDPVDLQDSPYYRFTGKDSAICCVLDENGEIVLVRQFRPNLGTYTLEFPAGGVDDNESSMEAMTRELSEEAGLDCKFISLGIFRLMMNRTTIQDHLFFGMDAKAIAGHISEEGIQKLTMKRSEFTALALSGEYEQLAGLGIIQLASLHLGADILTADISKLRVSFNLILETYKK